MKKRTSSHLQPQTYGDKSKLIDYSILVKPNLDEYLKVIKTII